MFLSAKKMKNFILGLSFMLLSVGAKAQNDELLKWNVTETVVFTAETKEPSSGNERLPNVLLRPFR